MIFSVLLYFLRASIIWPVVFADRLDVFRDLGDRTNLFRSEFHVFVWHDIFEPLHVLDQHILVLDRRQGTMWFRSHIGQYSANSIWIFLIRSSRLFRTDAQISDSL